MKPVSWTVLLLSLLTALVGAAETPVERTHFRYYVVNERHIERADSVLALTRGRLFQLLGDTLDYKANVYIVEDLERFRELTSGVFPDWGAAAAVPVRRRIVLKAPDKFPVNKSLEELLAHEYTHLLINKMAGFRRVPRWFEEGMAMYVSTEWGWNDNLAMSKAAVLGNFIPLAEIENVNRFGQDKAHVAYAQSFLAVRYLMTTYGEGALRELIRAAAAGADPDGVILAASGSDSRGFQREYEEYLKKHYNIATLFMDTAFIWIGLAIIVVVAAFLRYRKRRQYFKKWEEEERLHSTDFDYGDPDNPEQIDDDEPWRS